MKEREYPQLTPDYNELQWVARQNVIQRYIDQINLITGRDDAVSTRTIIRHFNEQLLLPLPWYLILNPMSMLA